MIIIVEGIDRVGKTTLCDMIEKQLGMRVYKKEREGGNENTSLPANILNFGNATGHLSFWKSDVCKDMNFVVDRFQWTEMVYSKILRKTPNGFMNIINSQLEKMDNVVMVLVKPVDLEWSSKKHGSDLSEYDEMFNDLFSEYEGNKLLASFYNLQETVDILKWRSYM